MSAAKSLDEKGVECARINITTIRFVKRTSSFSLAVFVHTARFLR